MLESKIQSAVLKYLHEKGIFAWRQNNLAIYDPKLNGYREHTGLKGVPDILAVIKCQFVGFEIKQPKGRQSADQLLFQKRLERNGGKYHIIRSLDDIKKLY